MVCRKETRISTIHEQLEHLSLYRFKLLVRSVITPKELANVDAPIYPGRLYGKVHLKKMRSKGVNNKK